MIHPGLCSITFRQLELREIIDLAATCGLEAIEWGGDVHVPPEDLSRAAEAGKATRGAGLKTASYGSYYRAGSGGGFSATLKASCALGAPNIRVWAGNIGSAAATQEFRALVASNLAKISAEADREGVTVSLEYHPNTLTDTLASTRLLLEDVGNPNLKTYWQPNPARAVDEHVLELRQLSPHLSNIHVFEWREREGQTVRLPLQEGRLEWLSRLRALTGDHNAMLEFVPNDDPSLLLREASTLRGLLSEIL